MEQLGNLVIGCIISTEEEEVIPKEVNELLGRLLRNWGGNFNLGSSIYAHCACGIANGSEGIDPPVDSSTNTCKYWHQLWNIYICHSGWSTLWTSTHLVANNVNTLSKEMPEESLSTKWLGRVFSTKECQSESLQEGLEVCPGFYLNPGWTDQ